MAEFKTADGLIAATKAAADAGYTRMDGYSPYPLGEVADHLGFPRSEIGAIMFIGGVVGATVGFLRFDDLVQEIFEVTLLPGLRFPEIAEPHSETVANGFVLAPPPSSPVPRPDGGRA